MTDHITPSDNHTPRDAERLRLWAQGLWPLEAAAWLLTHALGGRLLTGPWVRETPAGLLRIDPDTAASESGYLSGGERRVLAIVTSLVSDSHPVDLGDAITGIDPTTAQLILTALGHAAGLLDATTGSAPAAPVADVFSATDSAPAASDDAELEAIHDELNPAFEGIIASLQMYGDATGMNAVELSDMISDRLILDESADS